MPDIITRALLESKGIPTRDIVAAIWGRKLSGGYTPTKLTGTLPLTFRSDGTALIDYRIYGNTVETQGVGVRTENLFDPNAAETSGNNIISDFMPLDPSELVLTMAFDIPLRASYNYEITYYDSTKTAISFVSGMGEAYKTRETVKLNRQSEAPNAAYVKFTLPKDLTNVLIQNGSTSGEHIPYGYKLPMVSRTGNLFDYTAKNTNNGYIACSYISPNGTVATNINWNVSEYIEVNPSETYTCAYVSETIALATVGFYDENKRLVGQSGTFNVYSVTIFKASATTKYVRISYRTDRQTKAMLTEGSTVPTSYIPYHRTDTPICIGNTQLMQDEYVSYSEQKIYKSISLYGINEYIDTLNLSTGILTRKVKKMVLNGTEDFVFNKYTYNGSFVLDIPDISLLTFRVFSNYFQGGDSLPALTNRKDKIFVTLAPGYKRQAIAIGSATWNSNVTAFKNFLAEKYASGNPVTVWYVLESPEITNLPVSSKASGTLEGYLAQSETPSPSNPIYPTYARAHYPTDPPVPLPELPTFSDADTVLDYEETPAPKEVWVKYKKGD